MPKKQKTQKQKQKQKQKGGGSPNMEFKAPPPDWQTINNPLVGRSVNMDNSVVRPTGYLSPMDGRGLPGVQSGGRYEFVGGEARSIGCEAGASIPSSGGAGTLNVRGGELWTQGGGAQVYVPSSLHDAYVPADVSGGQASLTVPTARYENLPSAHPFDTSSSGNLMVTKAIEPSRGGGKKSKSKKQKQKTRSKRSISKTKSKRK
jgi:hypothetical protein